MPLQYGISVPNRNLRPFNEAMSIIRTALINVSRKPPQCLHPVRKHETQDLRCDNGTMSLIFSREGLTHPKRKKSDRVRSGKCGTWRPTVYSHRKRFLLPWCGDRGVFAPSHECLASRELPMGSSPSHLPFLYLNPLLGFIRNSRDSSP